MSRRRKRWIAKVAPPVEPKDKLSMFRRGHVSKKPIVSSVTAFGALVSIAMFHPQQAAALDCESPMSTVDQNQCSEIEFKKADAELNAAYRKALGDVAKSDSEPPYDAKSFEAAVRKSQRAWVAWRDAECQGVTPMFWTGGTATTSAVLGCMIEKTKARTTELTEKFSPQ